MFRIFFFFLFLCSCARVNPAYIDPEFDPYVKTFTNLIGIYPIGVSISLVDELSDNRVGQCRLNALEASISINRAYWHIASQNGKEQTILHELGHCFLDLDHDLTEFPNTCPKSIMYPVAFGDSVCYVIHRDELLRLYKVQSKL